MNLKQDTFIALSTPIGESAIAIIRANGPLVPSLIQSIFKEPAPTPRKVQTRNYTAICGNAIDYCSFTYFQTPHSYTGDDILEINCHGNPLIIQKIINDLLSRNCRLAQAGEFTRRAYENKKIDLTQAEAVQALIHAKNERALYLAKKQLEGSLGNYMQFIINELITCMAHIEASIDFSDEDLSTTQKAPLETLK